MPDSRQNGLRPHGIDILLWAAICYYDEPPTIAGTLDILTETPTASAQSPNADVLSDLLHVVRLSGSIFWKAEFGAPFAVVSYGQPPMPPGKRATRQHGTIFHLIAEGGCWLEVPGRPRIELGQGDVMLLPFGDQHMFGSGEAEPIPADDLAHAYLKEGVVTTMRHGGPGARTTIVCGYVQSGDLFFNPIFREMPALLVERTEGEPVTSLLASTVRALLAEVEVLRPGSRDMLGRMMEMLFVEMLRRYVAQLPQGTVGWFGALADPIVSRALQAIHAEPTRDWTVEELASYVGASRSVLADRFKAILGQPPMQYLAAWRLQLATAMLRAEDCSIGRIALAVGYESEAAFSRAFKRQLGVPPGAWRQQNSAA